MFHKGQMMGVLKMITTFSSHGFFVGNVFSHGFDWFVAHDDSRKVWSPDWCKVLVRILSFYWEFVSSICSCSWTAEHVSPTEHVKSHRTYSMLFSSCQNMQNYTVLCRAKKDTSKWALDSHLVSRWWLPLWQVRTKNHWFWLLRLESKSSLMFKDFIILRMGHGTKLLVAFISKFP